MVGDVYQAIIRCNYSGNDVFLNVLHYEVDVDGGGLASAADLALSVEQTFGDLYKAWMTLNCSWENVTCRRVYPVPPGVPAASAQEAGPGENDNGTALPPADAIVISKLTAFAGRGYRGRLYLGGLNNGNITNGRLDLPYPPVLDSIGAALIQSRVTPNATYRPCLYTPDKTNPNVKGRVSYLTGFKVRDIVRTQRRRQIGRGD